MSDPTEWLGEPGWDPVVIVDYNPKWPTRFAHFEDVLRAALGPRALRIDHVGSTAVPGLAAKPVIDIQVSVADVADEHAYRPPMEALGLRPPRIPPLSRTLVAQSDSLGHRAKAATT